MMKNRTVSSFFKFCSSIFVFTLIITALYAEADTSSFKWSVDKSSDTINVNVKVPLDFYLYKDFTSVILKDSQNRTIQPTVKPDTVNYKDEFGAEHQIYPSGSWKWTYKITENAKYTVDVKYQGCSKKPFACYPPETFTQTIAVNNSTRQEMAKKADLTFQPVGSTNKTNDSFLNSLLEKGGLWIFLVAFIGGLFSVFTPCVLPLIPITLAVLGAGEEASRTQAFRRSFLYVIGIIITFTILAVFASLTGKAFGSSILSNPVILGLFAIFFILMAFSLLGLYDFQLPSSLSLRLNNVGGNSNFGALLMGLVAGFIAIPCTGPVLATLLGVTAAAGNILWGAALLATYAIGFGIPFFVIGIGLVKAPKSGEYMNLIKSLLGVIILILAFYILTIVLPQVNLLFLKTSLAYKIIALTLIIMGVIMGAFHGDGHSISKLKKSIKALGAIFVAFGIIWILKQPSGSIAQNNLNWNANLSEVFSISKQENKPVILDFTAEWCTACKELESLTFSNSSVEKELKSNWVLAKVDATRNTEEVQGLINKYKVKGFPTVILFTPDGKEKLRFSGFKNSEDFLAILKSIK